MQKTAIIHALCHVMLVWVMHVHSFSPDRSRRNVADFDLSQLQGQWYDVGRTTYMWGPDTWTSQQWNFVQGEDGTAVALFNGLCQVCGGCSDTIVFNVRASSDAGGVFLLEGHGQTLSLHVEFNLQTEIVVSICFGPGVVYASDCPKSKLQVSVLSRQRRMNDVTRWLDIIRHLPVSFEELDTSSGEGCPNLFIDPKLVTEELVEDTDTNLVNRVGFDDRNSAILLSCSVGKYAANISEGVKVRWAREDNGTVLTEDDRILQEDPQRMKLLLTAPGVFNLLLLGVAAEDSGIYTCYIDGDDARVPLSRVVVTHADFTAEPVVVYHSNNVTALQGNTAVMECYVNSNPPSRVTWWKKTSGESDAYLRTGKKGFRKKIKDVQRGDEGVYKCEASNGLTAPVFALVNLQVGFIPTTEVEESTVSALYDGDAVLTCHVTIKSTDTVTWQKDGLDIRHDYRHTMSIKQTSETHHELTLYLRQLRKGDFGEYKCVAKDRHGESFSSTQLIEEPPTGSKCTVSNIPVMDNFNIRQFLGEFEVIQTTHFLSEEHTFDSSVQGFFITVSGSLVHYHRGFSTVKKHCTKPEASSLVRLDSPGDYLLSMDGGRGRYKIIYTDYTHAVVYFCMGGDDHEPCPQHLVRVQILSRASRIPDDDLQRLYGYVLKTCVPISSLTDSVPGICKMPPDFMRSNGYIGHYPEPNCQVANLHVSEYATVGHVTGAWHLIGEVRPDDYKTLPRNSLYIVPSMNRLLLFHRSGIRSGLCSVTEAGILHESHTAGSYYFDHKGLAVDSKFLYADDTSLVMYTCLALRHDGSCYSGAELVELFHRSLDIDDHSLLWLTRSVANACVDIKHLRRLQPSGRCTVSESVLRAADDGLVKSDHMHIGCHQKLIPVAEGFTEQKFAGHWVVVYRNTDSLNEENKDLSQFSQSYEVVKRPGGKLLLLVRHFESQWNSCSPTRSLEMTKKSGPGDYVHPLPSGTVVFKVLSLSGDNAVVYWCQRVTSEGICRSESLTVEILVRSPQTVISDERLQDMRQCSINVCVELNNLQPTSQSEKCSIPPKMIGLARKGQVTSVYDVPVLSCEDQLLRGASDLNVEKLTGEWTVLWRNDKYLGARAPNAESSFIILTHYGLLYLWRSYNNDLERCQPEEAGKFVRTSGPGDYYSGFDGVPVSMKILQTDYNTMVALRCHLDDLSHCHPDRTTVEILSRKPAIDNATRDALMESVDLTCLGDAQWVASEPDLCRVEHDVLTSAYIDGVNAEYSRIGCRVDLIGSEPGVTDDMIVGSWRSVYQSNLSESDAPAASAAFHFTKTPDGPISLLFRPYSSERQECLPARLMELNRDTSKAGTAFELTYCDSATPYGYMFMLYANDSYLAVLLCDVQKDSMCDPSTLNLVLLQREGLTLSVNQTLIDTVRGLGADACVDYNSLVIPTLDPCPISESILKDVAEGELQSCARHGEVQCYPQYIPVHKGFDIREFTGQWYSIGDSGSKDWPHTTPVGSATYHFASTNDSTLAMLYSPQSNGECQPTQLRLLRAVGESGTFIFTFNNTQEPYPVPEEIDLTIGTHEIQIALMKVVWLDDDFAVTYWCLDAASGDPWCQHRAAVSVLSRHQRGGEVASLPLYLRSVVADVCASSQNFSNIGGEPCEIPSSLVSAVENDSTEISASFSVIQCAEQFIPTAADFNMEQFSGVWHTVSQTQHRWGNNTWQSLVRSVVVQDDGSAVMAFTGRPPSENHCMPMEVKGLNLTDQMGQWTYTEGSDTVSVKVMWTDYNSSAVLYTCWGQVREDGLCNTADLQVEFLSRTTELANEAEEVLQGKLTGLCVAQKDMVNVTTGLCQITKDLELLVGSGSDDNTETLTSCKVKDIPLEQNFTIVQMTGIWYEISRTRFTFNTMESVISVYHYNPEKDYMDGLFIGTLHDQCQSPLKSTTKKKFPEGSDAIIEGRIQAGESIFPWITFNIMYFDGEFMLHMACYLENEDGTCPRDKMEITLLGRSRRLDKQMEDRLEGLLKSVCLTPDDMVPTKEIVDCMPVLIGPEEDSHDLPDTSSCQLTDIPVVEELNVDDLLGTWYGLGSVDYGMKEEGPGFVVAISRRTASTLQWRQWNIREGSCQAEKTIYMKAACTGSNTGDYISTRSSSFMLQWTTVKFLRFTGDLLLVYKCMQETDQGACRPEGIRVDLLGRSSSASLDDMIPLLSTLPAVCLKPENLKAVTSSSECDHLASEVVPMIETSPCAVDSLPAVNVDIEKISGLWYATAHSRDVMLPLQNTVLVYKALPDNQLTMYLTAIDPSGKCLGPMQGRMRQRCRDNPGPEIMGRLKFPGIWSWAPWRVVHADYNRSLIGLSCMDEQPDGSCSDQGIKIHFLSREPHPGPGLRVHLYNLLTSLGCFNHLPMEDDYHEGPSCKHKLEDLLLAPGASTSS
ncbi:uncharacterized protein [Littorina saxatilis]|uniref:uncharacterized protein isoform X2 n=1 Tax=Littorina saxatilis TaxID=31220 RepID=UPI0038B5F350